MTPPAFDEDPPRPPARHDAGATAWVLVFFDGLLLACGSLYWLVRGRFFDENVYRALAGTPSDGPESWFPATGNVVSAAVRLGGVLGLCASILVMAIALTGYRTGERWAWYATWAVPFYCSLEIATLESYRALTPTVALWDVGLLSIALFALVGGYRWFFAPPAPRPEPRRQEPTRALP